LSYSSYLVRLRLAEEYDPTAKPRVGNFPQAFSHLVLINSAHNLTAAGGPAHKRATGSSKTKGTIHCRPGLSAL
jgi:hypothetical protein